MTRSKVKLDDCPPPPPLHLPPPPPPPSHPHPTMATHQPQYQHRLRLQQQMTEDDEGVEMTCTGRSYKAGGGVGVPAATTSIILHHHRPPWHIKDEVLPQVNPSFARRHFCYISQMSGGATPDHSHSNSLSQKSPNSP